MSIDERIRVESVRPEACVVLAERSMNAEELERLSVSGNLTLSALRKAYLEVGGLRVAQGRIRIRAGKAQFVITQVTEGAAV